jgi:hypothetical protein
VLPTLGDQKLMANTFSSVDSDLSLANDNVSKLKGQIIRLLANITQIKDVFTNTFGLSPSTVSMQRRKLQQCINAMQLPLSVVQPSDPGWLLHPGFNFSLPEHVEYESFNFGTSTGRFNPESLRVILNPSGVDKCVQKCLLGFSELHNLIDDEVVATAIGARTKDLMTMTEIVCCCVSAGLNLQLCRSDNTVICFMQFEHRRTVTLMLDDSDGGHCLLLEAVDIVNPEPLTAITNDASFISPKLCSELTLHGQMQPTALMHVWLSNWTINMDLRYFGLDNIMARLGMESWFYVQVDVATPVLHVEWQVCEDGSWVTTTDHMINDFSVWLLQSIHGWIPALLYMDDERMHALPRHATTPTGTICINTRASLRFGDVQSGRVIRQFTDTATVCLNPSTYRHATQDRHLTGISKTIPSDVRDLTVLVWNYDNRSHHDQRQSELLKRAHRVEFLGPNPSLTSNWLAELAASYDQPINRLSIWHGELKYSHEFQTTCMSSIVSIMCTGEFISSYVGTTTITKRPLSRAIRTWIDKNVVMQGNKCMAKFGIDGWPQVVPKAVMLKNWFNNNTKRYNLILVELGLDTDSIPDSGVKWQSYNKHVNWPANAVRNLLRLNATVVTIRLHNWLFIPCCQLFLRPLVDGGLNLGLWKDEKAVTMTHQKEAQAWWWSRILPATNTLKPSTIDSSSRELIHNLSGLRTISERPTSSVSNLDITDWNEDEEPYLPFIEPFFDMMQIHKLEPLMDFTNVDVINLWENTDQTDWLALYCPMEGRLVTREQPQSLSTIRKYTMTKYPIMSRPVISKVCYEEGRSIIGRLYSVQHLRKLTPEPFKLINKMISVYFIGEASSMLQNMQEQPIVYKPQETLAWIEKHKFTSKVLSEVVDMLSGELSMRPLNMLKIHLKMESLLKEGQLPITNFRQQQARIIAWQRYAIAAIFSPIFVEAKARMKTLLKSKFVYTDGLTPSEISNRLRLVPGVVGFLENDLKKQDRQSDEPILLVEMLMYKLLGVHPELVDNWFMVHDHWSFKSNNYRGRRHMMRTTGQATTALGNLITNFQVHCEFFRRNFHSLGLVVFLGDDMLALLTSRVSTTSLHSYIKTRFNMFSKDHIRSDFGTFCSFIAYKTGQGNAELGPDVVRLKNRFEVTNGVSDVTIANLEARSMSYLMSLGGLANVKEIINRRGLPIRPLQWYSPEPCFQAVAAKYNMSYDQVIGYLDSLLQMIDSCEFYEHEFLVYSSKYRK